MSWGPTGSMEVGSCLTSVSRRENSNPSERSFPLGPILGWSLARESLSTTVALDGNTRSLSQLNWLDSWKKKKNSHEIYSDFLKILTAGHKILGLWKGDGATQRPKYLTIPEFLFHLLRNCEKVYAIILFHLPFMTFIHHKPTWHNARKVIPSTFAPHLFLFIFFLTLRRDRG